MAATDKKAVSPLFGMMTTGDGTALATAMES
jgi:hypothetical protein